MVETDTLNNDELASIEALTAVMNVSSITYGLCDIDESNPPPSSEGTDVDEIQRVQQVEAQLYKLVDQIPAHDINESKEVGQPFLESPATKLPALLSHTYPCKDSYNVVPADPIHWPQAPIMIRPTPNTQMVIRGIRYANSTTYQTFPGLCAGCILPINTGYERPGQSLVIDFESPLFIGTIMVRVKGAKHIRSGNSDTFLPNASKAATKTGETKDSPCYFDGKKRQFQVVVKGRFKRDDIPMTECVTGQAFDRPAGKLPASMIVNTFIKLIATLAPQLEVELDSRRPRFLSPLIATAHTVIVNDSSQQGDNHSTAESNGSEEADAQNDPYSVTLTIEDDVEEPPPDDPSSVIAILPSTSRNGRQSSTISIVQRRAIRKKAFNRIAAARDCKHKFDLNKEYTFEFFQHLLLLSEPDEFKINMGHNIQMGLTKALNGQPIRVLAAQRRANHSLSNDKDAKSSIAEVLWSFDLWHQSLYPIALSMRPGNGNL